MLVHLPTLPTVIIDIAAWFIIHLGVSYLMTQIPLVYFDVRSILFRPRRWERDGRIYTKFFGVKRWKENLPDGAAVFKKGFVKKRLRGLDSKYLNDFIRETCRAELTHWIVIGISPVFFAWNLWFVGIIMIAYAMAANLPCVITQRYNRIRLIRIFSIPLT